MIAHGWFASLARAAIPWLVVLILALACRHYAALAQARAHAIAHQEAGFRMAQGQAEAAARAALAQQQRRWREQAQKEDAAHEIELEKARAAGLRYGAAHRLQPAANAGAAGPAAAPATDRVAGLRPPVPAAGIVVSAHDVQACSEVTAYALALRDWALGLREKAAASPEDGGR